MIVKNEERFLDDCLSALKPLLDAVSSELVIVDTGSTDATVDIAKKYTDKIYNFTWVNDFSAARNFGLEKCVGEWFMWIDADEVFDTDISGIKDFFLKSKLNKKYNCANFLQQSYHDEKNEDYALLKVLRVVRLQKDTKFADAVHEHINYHLPLYDIPAAVHHYGYVPGVGVNKSERNLPMLWDLLAKNPNDSRIIYHIIQEDFEGRKEWILEHIPYIIKSDDYYTKSLYVICSMVLVHLEEWEEALRISDLYFARFADKNDALMLDLYFVRVLCFRHFGKDEEVVNSYHEFERLYKMYKSDSKKLNKSALIHVTLRCLGNRYYVTAEKYAREAELRMSGKLYADLAEEYTAILKSGNAESIVEFERGLERKFFEERNQRTFCENFVNEDEGRFFELTRLVKAQARTDSYCGRLEKFLSDMPIEGFSYAITLAMNYNADILPAVRRMSEQQISEQVSAMSGRERHFAGIVYRYLKSFPPEHFAGGSLESFYLAQLLENALNKEDDSFKEEYAAELREMYKNLDANLKGEIL